MTVWFACRNKRDRMRSPRFVRIYLRSFTHPRRTKKRFTRKSCAPGEYTTSASNCVSKKQTGQYLALSMDGCVHRTFECREFWPGWLEISMGTLSNLDNAL